MPKAGTSVKTLDLQENDQVWKTSLRMKKMQESCIFNKATFLVNKHINS